MERKEEILYVPITIRLCGFILLGLYAPKGYSGLNGIEVAEYPPKDNPLPENEVRPVKLQINGEHMPPGILATQVFFRDVEYLKRAKKLNRILQLDGWFSIAENNPVLLH
jgi:hypothetical protein